MHYLCSRVLLILGLIGITVAATTYELEAKKFIHQASDRAYKLYNQIAEETYGDSEAVEDFEAIFSKLSTVQKIAQELISIADEAKGFDLSKIPDENTKEALERLRRFEYELFVLGDEYFSTILINFASLKELSTDKDIEPYLGGVNRPDQDDSPIAYYPDIQKIFEKSNSSEELKYYWEAFRDKNSVWAGVNFLTIIEAFKSAATKLNIPVLEFWFRFYENKDFLNEMEKVMEEIKPAYQQLHAFIRQELYKKYGADAIDLNGPIPDHLFQQVTDQAWQEGSIIESYFPQKELPPYDKFVEKFQAKEMIDEVERFYTSLGFDPLGNDFRENQLKEHDEETNSGDCRADIFDITPKALMLYCSKVDFRKFMQTHGYLARIYYAKEKKDLPAYYFDSYDLEYPVGEAVILSASTPKHLSSIGLAEGFKFTDQTLRNRLFRMGIHTLLKIPLFFVNTKVVTELLNGTVDMDNLNKHYWKLMEQYAGVEPPVDRSEGSIDFPHSFYLDIDENHQTRKFVSEILGYQFYRALCAKSGQADQLHNCDFYGNLAVGQNLKSLMALGSSKPWRQVLAKILPEKPSLSGEALLEYYAPILDWIKLKNKETNAKIGWNESKKKVL